MLRRDGGSRLTNITILRNRKKFGTGFEDAVRMESLILTAI
ncbi:hypothetical protein LEP1GSC133_3048 [Leptospira borgpetersenii serovar Pomona str. 200901868]|uniref:Uncharacterized protein n=1 Tax=Leptospira borgpetersenii serovar Pomona str. 200901868 TaxID=1192866 RepID=M6W4T9_LEPBO|nr:hypothetical protein LEP1GSC133_3048 [Leptospira borgpetersenii serovar Pomona str. 200901868]